ncbi:polyprenol reductase-like [Liolophura sinensis]|uniref:polyprenol reductase-like n=1 Tax=Liolophura sinensis TaxID=3198878 RepID=UPI003157F32C
MAVFVLCLGWLVLSLGVLIGYILMHLELLPIPIKHLYLFGKLRKRTEPPSFVRYADVPKRWFLHFYLIGLVCNTSALMIILEVWKVHLPGSTEDILQVLHIGKANYRAEPSPVLPVLLVLVCEELQVLRRLYECMAVSVYSDSKMSVIHYFTGIIMYSTFGVSLLAELSAVSLPAELVRRERMPTEGEGELSLSLPLSEVSLLTEVVSRERMPTEVNWGLSLPQCLGLVVFVWAWCKQYSLTKMLARLRTQSTSGSGDISHHLPSGDLFELVSCPHYLMEILLYTSFCLITRFQSPTLNCVACFVLVNQLISAQLTHTWYRASFYKYPPHRRAILPYLL